MRILQAAQVVYANVEADRSPQRRGGFQTLFRSLSQLTENDVTREIEPRLFFDSRGGQQTKHLFFTITDGRVVLAQVIPLSTTDDYGRTGLYFGHALVLSPVDFRKFDNNPFHIFNGFSFFRSVDQAFAADVTDQGDIPLADLPPPQLTAHRESDGISRNQLFHLCVVAQRLLRSPDRGSAIGFYGEASKTLEILRDMFSLIPVSLRLGCSFDTLFSGGTFGRTPYLAVGLTADEAHDPRFACFDVEKGAFIPPAELQPQTSYDAWLRWMLHPPLADIARQVDSAYGVSQLLDGQQPSGDQRPISDSDSLLAFRPILQARLSERLKIQIGDALSYRILPQVLTWAHHQGLAALESLTQGFSDRQLETWLCEAYEHYHEKPSTVELEHLEKFSLRNQSSFLRLICLRWNQQWYTLRTSLRSVEVKESNRFKGWALASISAYAQPVVHPVDGLLLGLGIRGGDLHSQETFELLAALLDISPEPLLSACSSSSEIPLATADTQEQQMQPLQPASIKQLISLLVLLVDGVNEKG